MATPVYFGSGINLDQGPLVKPRFINDSEFNLTGQVRLNSSLNSLELYTNNGIVNFLNRAHHFGNISTSIITDFYSSIYAVSLSELSPPVNNLNISGNRLINVATPVNSNDAVTKGYVDNLLQGLSYKGTVRLCTTQNISLTGIQTIDTITCNPDDIILVRNQNDSTQNGIYISKSGSWIRAYNFDTSDKVKPGSYVFVSEGDLNKDTTWLLTTDDPITLGVSNIIFDKFSNSLQFSFLAGLSNINNDISVNVDNQTIFINNSNQLALKNSSITGDHLNSSILGNGILQDITTKALKVDNSVILSLANIAINDLRGSISGIASLDTNGKVPLSQLYDIVFPTYSLDDIQSPTTDYNFNNQNLLDVNQGYYQVLDTQSLKINLVDGVLKIVNGLVGSGISTDDVPEGSYLYYTNARVESYLTTVKNIADGILYIDSTGKIPVEFLPPTSITDVFVVDDLSEQLALSAQIGDVAVRTDINKSFILKSSDPSILSNWQELLTPTDSVLSVNGQSGTVVLNTSHVSEVGNLYFTDLRARAAISNSLPITYNSSSGVIGIQQSSGSVNGYLSSTDWNTFNNKINSVNGKTGNSITLILNEIGSPISSYSFNYQNLTNVNFLSASRLGVNNASSVGIFQVNTIGGTLSSYAIIKTSGGTAYSGGLLITNSDSTATGHNSFKLSSTFNGTNSAQMSIDLINNNNTETALTRFMTFAYNQVNPFVEINTRTVINAAIESQRNTVTSSDTSVLTNITQNISHDNNRITVSSSVPFYSSGLTWRHLSDNPTKPKASMYLELTNNGSIIHFGTSNNYITGLTSDVSIDYNGAVKANSLALGGGAVNYNQPLTTYSSTVHWLLNNPSAGTDEKISRVLTESSGKVLRFDIANDAYTATKPYLTVLRSGLNVNETKLYANNLIQLGINTGNYVVIGDFNNSSTHSGNTSVAYGEETFRYNLGFRQWKDSSYNQIGARISSVSYNKYASGSALEQSTALVFATSSTSGSTSGTFTDNSTDRMRITPEGNFEFGALSGSQSFFDIGLTKMMGASHSDILRVRHHHSLTDTIGDLRIMSSFGVQAGGNNMALSSMAVRTGNALDWTTAAVGLVLTVDNTLNPFGGQLILSSFNGIGGIAINHNLAQARLHVEAQEKYSSLFVTNHASPGGVNIVNKNTTNSSFISLSSVIGEDHAYIEKIPLANTTYLGAMYIGNTEGDIVLRSKSFDLLRVNDRYAKIKTSPSTVGRGGLLLSNTTTELSGHYSFKQYATYGTTPSLLYASMGFVENSDPDTSVSEMLGFHYNNGSPYIYSLVTHYGNSFISNKYTVNATGKSLLSEVTANQDFATNIVRSQVLFPSFTSLLSHVTQGSEAQAKTGIISEITGGGSYLHLRTSDNYASGLTSGVKINPTGTVVASAFAVGVDNYNPLSRLHIKDTINVLGFFEGATITGSGLLVSNSHNESSSFLSFGRTDGVLSGEAYISKFNPGHANSNDFRFVNTEGSVSIFANSVRSVYTLNQKTTIGGSNSIYSSLSVVSSSETALNSSMVSDVFQISAGTLGSTVNNTLDLASFGFRSHNTTLLNIRAYRRSAGSDWNTAGVYFSYDVDTTANPQGSMFSMYYGRFGWNTVTPWSKFSIEGGTTIDAGLSIRSGDVTLNMTHHVSDNSGMIQVRSSGDSTVIGTGTYKLRINTDGGDVYVGHDLNSQVILPDNVRLSNNFYTTPTTHVNPAMYVFNNLNIRYGVKLHYMSDPANSAVSGFGTLLFMSNQTNNWLGFGRSENTTNTDSAYTVFGRFEQDGAFRLSNNPKSTLYSLGIGNTEQDYTPTSGNWSADGTTLLLNALTYSTIGFHDLGIRVDFIRVGGGVIELGYDGGWGNAVTKIGGDLEMNAGGITGNYTMIDYYRYIYCNNTSAITVTMMSAGGRSGREHTISRSSISTASVTIVPTGTEKVGGGSSLTVPANGSITLYSNGSEWILK